MWLPCLLSMRYEVTQVVLLSVAKRCFYRLLYDGELSSVFIVETDDQDVRRFVDEKLRVEKKRFEEELDRCKLLDLAALEREYSIGVSVEEQQREQRRRLLRLFTRGGAREETITYRLGHIVVALGHVEVREGTVNIVPEKTRDSTCILNVVVPLLDGSAEEIERAVREGRARLATVSFLVPDTSQDTVMLYKLCDSDGVTASLPSIVYAQRDSIFARLPDIAVESTYDPVLGIRRYTVIGRIEHYRDSLTGRTYITVVPYVRRADLAAFIIGNYRLAVADAVIRDFIVSAENLIARLEQLERSGHLDDEKLSDIKAAVLGLVQDLREKINYVYGILNVLMLPYAQLVEDVRYFLKSVKDGYEQYREQLGLRDMADMFYAVVLRALSGRPVLEQLLGTVESLRRGIALEEQIKMRPIQIAAMPPAGTPQYMPHAQSYTAAPQYATPQQTQHQQQQQHELARLLEEIRQRLQGLEERVSKLEQSAQQKPTAKTVEGV